MTHDLCFLEVTDTAIIIGAHTTLRPEPPAAGPGAV